ncbi:hypothetical protein ACFPOE_13215 [Caenimonas terrae]|uniref:SMP-30/Gluconolactonase/LRE-like region domain-containing protein n=1 Tax=Caenimonas terrae TaxID=696074 RepID=A0ABW0NEY7_9BURK
MKFSLAGSVAARSFAAAVAALLVACGGGGGGSIAPPPAPVLSVFAGLLQSAGSSDGVGVAARLNQPGGAVLDSAGVVYVADTGNHTIRRITPLGVVTTIAGTAGQSGNADGTGTTARLSSPVGLALDAGGNLYVADSGNKAVRRISTGGVVTTVATLPDAPTRLALDRAGGIYVLSDQALRRLAPDGSLTTLPIQPGAGAAAQAPFGLRFSGIAVDGDGNLLVADTAASGVFSGVGTVRKVDAQGRSLPYGPAADGLVRIAFPQDIAIDGAGNLLVANDGSFGVSASISFIFRTLVRVAPDGTQTVIAGAEEAGRTVDGAAALARFTDPRAIAAGPNGQVVVVETGSNAVRLLDPLGTVRTLAGGNGAGHVDGAGPQARFDGPQGIAAAADGSLYVAELVGRSIRKISPAGIVTTWMPAGSPPGQRPVSVAVNRAGTVYASDLAISIVGRPVYTVAAGGSTTFVLTARSSGLSDAIATDAAGNLVLSEPDGIKSVAPDGSKRVLASGIEAVALAADGSGTVYFATSDGTVGTVDASGQAVVRAGVAGQIGDQDGVGALARFRRPAALAVDAAGTLYVADGLRIRRVAADGTVMSIADLATMDGADPARSIAGLAWANGTLFATLQNAVVRIGPVS